MRQKFIFAILPILILIITGGCLQHPVEKETSGKTPDVTVVPTQQNVVKDPNEVPPAIYPRTTPTTVRVNLEAREVVAEIAPGKRFLFWTYAEPGKNATVPAPMIRVMEGDTLIINLTSAPTSVRPHNIDFHAAMGPGGGAAVTNVNPGETKTFKFKALRAGAYIYHCSGEGKPWEHVAHGIYGLIMVEPVGGLPPVDKEFYVGQSDWYLKDDSNSFDEKKARSGIPDFFTFNGHTGALTAIKKNMVVNQGKTVRIFFVTGGPNIGSNFHIIGTIFDRVYTGHPDTAIKNEETVYVAPGSAAVIELTAPVPGDYLLVDHTLWRAASGALGILHVNQTGAWPEDIYYPPETGSGH